MIALFSDLLDLPEETGERIAALAARRRVVVVVQVLDPEEIEFPFSGPVRLTSLEGSLVVDTDADTVRERYLAALAALQRDWEQKLSARGARLVLASSADDPVGVVLRVLRAVAGGRRVSFAVAAALGVAALLVVPALAHLLRRGRARELAFPPAALVPNTRSTARQKRRLEDRLLLALRVLSVILLALLGADAARAVPAGLAVATRRRLGRARARGGRLAQHARRAPRRAARATRAPSRPQSSCSPVRDRATRWRSCSRALRPVSRSPPRTISERPGERSPSSDRAIARADLASAVTPPAPRSPSNLITTSAWWS